MKDGYKTTEFWVTVTTALAGLVGQFGELIPPPWGLVVSAVVTAAYNISRGFAKGG